MPGRGARAGPVRGGAHCRAHLRTRSSARRRLARGGRARRRRVRRALGPRRLRGPGAFLASVIALIVYFVFHEAWPALRENSFGIFGTSDRGGPPASARRRPAARLRGLPARHAVPAVGLWPAIYGTILFTPGATALTPAVQHLLRDLHRRARAAPARSPARADRPPAGGHPVRHLRPARAAVIAPQIDRFLVIDSTAAKLAPVVPINGRGLLLGVVTLFVMVAPIMIAIFADSLRAVPCSGGGLGYALGVDRGARSSASPARHPTRHRGGHGPRDGPRDRRGHRPPMAAGSLGFSPNPLDGSGLLPRADPAARRDIFHSRRASAARADADLFAIAARHLVSALALSLVARIATLPFRTESTRV